jgi:hypothetical protein
VVVDEIAMLKVISDFLKQILSQLQAFVSPAREVGAALLRIEANQETELANQERGLVLLAKILEVLTPPAPVRFRIALGEVMAKVTKATVDFQINENGTATATLVPVDANGNDTSMPAGASVPVWTASDPDISVAQAADGMSAVFTAGTTAITAATATATSTLADGTTLTGTTDPIDVIPNPPGAATRFRIALSK